MYDLSALQNNLDKKLGKNEIQVVSRTKGGRHGLVTLLNIINKKKYIVPVLNIYDRKTKASILLDGNPSLIFKERVSERAQKIADAEATSILSDLGLTSIYKYVHRIKDDMIFMHLPTRKNFPIKLITLRNEVHEARDIVRRAAAWIRFKSRKPVTYTDREWQSKILAASAGAVISAEPYPKAPTKTGYRLKCLKCNCIFNKKRLFNTKNTVIHCECSKDKSSKNYSKSGIKWLEDMETRFDIHIQKATSVKGEKKVLLGTVPTHVDGYISKYNIAFEYHGSRWHGNPLLFYPDELSSPYSKDTAYKLLAKTLKREQALIKAGYKLIRIWDQDFLNEDRYEKWLLLNSPRLKKFLSRK